MRRRYWYVLIQALINKQVVNIMYVLLNDKMLKAASKDTDVPKDVPC